MYIFPVFLLEDLTRQLLRVSQVTKKRHLPDGSMLGYVERTFWHLSLFMGSSVIVLEERAHSAPVTKLLHA